MMRAELSQPPVLKPGYALVTVTASPELDPSTLLFSVEQPPRGFLQELGDTAWGTTHAWLRPSAVSVGEEGLGLTLGPEHTWNLRPNVTYVLRLRDASRSEPLALRIAWKGIRMPSQAPQKLPDLPGKPTTVGLTDPKPLETKIGGPNPKSNGELTDKPKLDISVDPLPRPRNNLLWIALAVLLLLGGGGGAWFLMHSKPHQPADIAAKPDSDSTPKEGTLGATSARAYVQQTPGSPATYAEAQRYLKDGSPDALQGALILLSRAADSGSGPARTALGRMYDPNIFTPQTSAMKAPDADKALLWYQRAAQANDPEGLYRLGKLLLSGRASAPGLGPEQGVMDLQRGAELGSKEAQEEIDKMRNNPR